MRETVVLKVIKRAPVSLHGPALFAMVRNESYFLPFFFAHYRAMGVDNFLIYNDRSDDSSCDFPHAQPDCTIMRSDKKFNDVFDVGQPGLPRTLTHLLKEEVPEAMFPGRWVLTVDADEFLILPPGFEDLPHLMRYLDDVRQVFLTAPMVDFYGETLDHRNYPRTLGPFAGNPYFDAGPYYAWRGGIRPVRTGGGVRLRLLQMLHQKHREQIPLIYGGHPVAVAKTWKVPLLKHGSGITSRVAPQVISSYRRALGTPLIESA